MITLESDLLTLRAERAADDTQLYEQQQQLAAYERQRQELSGQLAIAKEQVKDMQQRMHHSLHVAAVAVASSGASGQQQQSTHQHQQQQQPGSNTAGSHDNIQSLREEVERQRRAAAAARSDKVPCCGISCISNASIISSCVATDQSRMLVVEAAIVV